MEVVSAAFRTTVIQVLGTKKLTFYFKTCFFWLASSGLNEPPPQRPDPGGVGFDPGGSSIRWKRLGSARPLGPVRVLQGALVRVVCVRLWDGVFVSSALVCFAFPSKVLLPQGEPS